MPLTRISPVRRCGTSATGHGWCLATRSSSDWRAFRPRISTTCAGRPAYRKIRVRVEHTQGSQVSIGERRQPEPKGRPGYLRVDTVHQGQHDGESGMYHLNAVDTVTQWQVVGGTETISERHLIPVLEAMLHQFPFPILGFHCDNGSEFLNYKVVGLLKKLLVEEFTKSRACRSTDNALVEG